MYEWEILCVLCLREVCNVCVCAQRAHTCFLTHCCLEACFLLVLVVLCVSFILVFFLDWRSKNKMQKNGYKYLMILDFCCVSSVSNAETHNNNIKSAFRASNFCEQCERVCFFAITCYERRVTGGPSGRSPGIRSSGSSIQNTEPICCCCCCCSLGWYMLYGRSTNAILSKCSFYFIRFHLFVSGALLLTRD